MPKNTFPQFCLILLFGAIVSVAVLPAVSKIDADCKTSNYIKFGEKDYERINNSL